MKPVKIQNLDRSLVAKVSFYESYNQYNVRLYFMGNENKNASYYTNDKSDAFDKALSLVSQ
jgi:hypothetical protein